MKELIKLAIPFGRREFLRATSALSAAAVMPQILGMSAANAQGASTIVIAAPATPQSLDCEYDVSLGTFEAIAALYDGLIAFQKHLTTACRRQCAKILRTTPTRWVA